MGRELHEECGIFGVSAKTRRNVSQLTYYGLYSLQHRGQESAGIVVNDDGVFSTYKRSGFLSDVFNEKNLEELGEGKIAVGHVRYSTSGTDNARNVQPIVVNHRKGRIALAHNGNLTNSSELRSELEEGGAIFHSTSDTEVIAYILVQQRLKCGSIEEAISATMDRIEGAYSLILSSPQKLIAVRDPFGFRPLCYGTLSDGSIVIASETCSLDTVGAKLERDLEPGEVLIVENDEIRSDKSHCNTKPRKTCIFEYIYFARPDSIIDGVSVSRSRQQAGRFLAQEHPVEADLVIGVPDSGMEAAIGYAAESGIEYGIGLTKNKYIGRTFISPEQALRESGVQIKLNPIREIVRGKRIVLVDDSIVRGTTSKRLVSLLRGAGATEIHFMSSAPPFIAPCYYGTDVDSAGGLIANKHSVDEIAKIIGADSLGYLSLEHLVQITGENTGFCTACFSGDYPTKISEDNNKNRFEQPLSEKNKEF